MFVILYKNYCLDYVFFFSLSLLCVSQAPKPVITRSLIEPEKIIRELPPFATERKKAQLQLTQILEAAKKREVIQFSQIKTLVPKSVGDFVFKFTTD